ncbi:MAG: hypothetical protein H8E03_00180 [Pelagibacteraceae bacterium]|nr:hypothetical protein [Pelagibacteraceae bacterium]
MTKEKTIEERQILALESIADSFKLFAKSHSDISESVATFEDVVLSVDPEAWSERLEWYLNEFYIFLKSKVIGSSSNRPTRKVPLKK